MPICKWTDVLLLSLVAGTPTWLPAQQSTPPAPGEPQAADILAVFGNLPVFQAAAYGASGSATAGTCSTVAGSTTLTCNFSTNDFAVGQGIHIVGAGPAAATQPIPVQPVVTRSNSAGGSHAYCYVVMTADPLEGISVPSPKTCVSNEPVLSYTGTSNALGLNYPNGLGNTPAFLWYVSDNGGPYQLVTVSSFTAAASDVGQRPGTRGGWPVNLPAANPDIAKNQDFYTTVAALQGNTITTVDAIPSTVSGAVTMHDDTQAVEHAILAADAAGGGTVQLGAGTYRIEQPFFTVAGTEASYPTYSTSLAAEYSFDHYGSLYLPSRSHGKLNVQGTGAQTVIDTPPDHGAASSLFLIGPSNRPNYLPGVLAMQDVAAGATSLTLTGGSGTLSAGDDIYLYSGTFQGSPCLNAGSTASGCHFSELNTVASVSGNIVNLVYPTSKRFYNDGSSSFGVVKTLIAPHDVAIQNMAINTYAPITYVGQTYGLVINGLQINGAIAHGAFGGGFKRDVTIENSSWTFGAGDASYNGTDEYDQFTHVAFLNDTITGYGAPGAEAFSLMPRIYGTEGSSQFTFQNNTLNHAAVYFDQTTGDVISQNVFNDAILNLGAAYGTRSFLYGPVHNTSFDSFGSQATATVSNNTFNEDSAYIPPFLLQIGHFDNAAVTGNVIESQSSAPMAAITAYSGNFTGNTLVLAAEATSIGMALVPDQSAGTPAAAFTVENNVLAISGFSIGIYVPDQGFTDLPGICVQGNTYQQFGLSLILANPFSVNQTCSQKAF